MDWKKERRNKDTRRQSMTAQKHVGQAKFKAVKITCTQIITYDTVNLLMNKATLKQKLNIFDQ